MSIDDDIRRLKAVTRDAHEATQELKTAIREGRMVKKELYADAEKALIEGIAALIQDGMVSYHAAVAQAIEEAQADVYKRFEILAQIMLGETREKLRRGESLADYATRIAEAEAELESDGDGKDANE